MSTKCDAYNKSPKNEMNDFFVCFQELYHYLVVYVKMVLYVLS